MYQDGALFVDCWRNARARTLRVLDRLPETDLEWTWAPTRSRSATPNATSPG